MRYLGNKESICEVIVDLLKDKGLLDKNLTFFDAFCGTGTVSNSLKNYFRLIINDNLRLATTFAAGRINSGFCSFEKLGFNPIDFFNSNEITDKGFFYNNYGPAVTGRMYFSEFNAGRIDFFRKQIETWKIEEKIDDTEYCYLLSCLLESVSKIANVAGVYGAYLKKWDPRAVKKIVFIEPEGEKAKFKPDLYAVYNSNLNEIIENIDCDILYLDPPYTKNKYTVQYHVLETLIRNDNPCIKGITGARNMSFASDSWSNTYEVQVELESTIAKTKAKYILMSYSSDGLMSKDYIMNVLRRHCIQDSVECLEINYKKYRNSKTFSTDEHFEYLFFGVKKNPNEVEYYCPLNYMGGKTNVIKYIKPYLNGRSEFYDIMGGGFNVGINAFGFSKFYYNDVNFIVKDLLLMFKQTDTPSLLRKIETIIKKYNLEKHNAETYFKLRNDYNFIYRNRGDHAIYLYTLILYGFQQQIRFNSNYEFNNPVGESGFNDSIREKIVSFSRRIKEMNTTFSSVDYENLEGQISNNSLVYLDPPYLITLGSYNDGKRGFNGWNSKEEERLLSFICRIIKKGSKIVLSNILDYKGNRNDFLYDWIKKYNPEIKHITVRNREEVLIIYDSNI